MNKVELLKELETVLPEILNIEKNGNYSLEDSGEAPLFYSVDEIEESKEELLELLEAHKNDGSVNKDIFNDPYKVSIFKYPSNDSYDDIVNFMNKNFEGTESSICTQFYYFNNNEKQDALVSLVCDTFHSDEIKYAQILFGENVVYYFCD